MIREHFAVDRLLVCAATPTHRALFALDLETEFEYLPLQRRKVCALWREKKKASMFLLQYSEFFFPKKSPFSMPRCGEKDTEIEHVRTSKRESERARESEREREKERRREGERERERERKRHARSAYWCCIVVNMHTKNRSKARDGRSSKVLSKAGLAPSAYCILAVDLSLEHHISKLYGQKGGGPGETLRELKRQTHTR